MDERDAYLCDSAQRTAEEMGERCPCCDAPGEDEGCCYCSGSGWMTADDARRIRATQEREAYRASLRAALDDVDTLTGMEVPF